MKKKNILKIVFIMFVLFISPTVFADTTVHLDIETNNGPIYNGNITVTPCESDGVMAITAYCALSQSNIPSDWSGLWTNSINGIVNNDNNNGVYWMWLANLNTNNPYSDFTCHQDAPYGCSAKQYILNPNDNILFYYNVDPFNLVVPPTMYGTPALSPSGGSAISTSAPITQIFNTTSTTPPKLIFDTKKAFDFLISQQKENGSFGEDLYTDWVALSLANTNDFENQKNKLIQYLSKNPTVNYQLTDYERHSMALMALGLNPYDVNGENHIKKIIDAFDGKQFGNKEQDNDDIFALIVLQNAGYGKDEDLIKNTINFILSNQKENGSWDESVDMTGAAIEALSSFSPTPEVGKSLEKAKNFLKQNQKDTGGWTNVSATSWVIEGITALSEKTEDWTINNPTKDGINNTPLDYLAINQDTDGGTKNEYLKNRIWETAYVLAALSGKTWNQIMQNFERPKEIEKEIKTEEKKEQKNITKDVVKKSLQVTEKQKEKNKIQTLENNAKQNTATALEANNSFTQTETKKSNWLKRFFNKIFGFN